MSDYVSAEDLREAGRLDVLLFSLGSKELFGINVFRVREVSLLPHITRTPNAPHGVLGLVSLRGNVLPVLSLSRIMGLPDSGAPDNPGALMVVEIGKRVLGFHIHGVEHIVPVAWSNIHAPEQMIANEHGFLTAVFELPDSRLVSILDVENILACTFGDQVADQPPPLPNADGRHVFFVDDSSFARRKISDALTAMGVAHHQATQGVEAWNKLPGLLARNELDVIIVDAEMPELDGYALVKKIREDSRFTGIPVIMHSAISSDTSRTMGREVGVDAYVTKFDSTGLATALKGMLDRRH